MKNKYQKGQAVLIVLLSLSVVLIIILYIVSRSVTDISLSTKDENSLRAFSAAEAGVERALVIGSSQSGTVDNASFNANVTSFGLGTNGVVYPLSLKSGDVATFWFNRPSEPAFVGSQARICWGNLSSSETPAIEATVYYRTTAGVYQVARAALDPSAGRTANNSFTIPAVGTCTVDGTTLSYQSVLNFTTLGIANYSTAGVLQFMTVKPLYNVTEAHKVAIDVSGSGSLLPSQGAKVTSDGSFSGSNRSVEVYQLHASVPAVFMNSLFSSGGIVK